MPGWIARINRRLMRRADHQKREAYVQAAYEPAALDSYHRILDRIGMPLVGKSILDVGCGPGHWLAASRRYQPRILVGGDLNIDMLHAARHAGAREHRIFLFQGDAMAIPAKSGRFDMVICSLVLPYVPSDHAVISELARVCKPDGWLLLSYHGLGFYMHHIIARKDWKYVLVPPLSWLSFITGRKLLWNTYQTLSRVRRLLVSAGCRITYVETDWLFLGLPCITHVIAQRRGR